MRHGRKINHLSRKSAHRKALLSNLASQLIMHKRIRTTVAKAKALRKYVEPLITKAKNDTTHSRRVVFSHLGQKESVKELFVTVADKIGERPGGYTRIIKLGNRLGDNAEMAMIELVDFNELLLEDKKKGKGRRKRTRRAGKGSESDAAATTETAETKTEEAPVKEEKAETKSEKAEVKEEKPAAEAKKETKSEAKEEKAEVKEEPKAEAKEEKKEDSSDNGENEDKK